MNQMAGGLGSHSSDQTGLLSDSSLPSSLNKWALLFLLDSTLTEYGLSPYSASLWNEPKEKPFLSSRQLLPDGSEVEGMGNLPAATPLSASGVRKAWHEHVTQGLRSHLVHKL